jgi:hypothetical protein
LGTAEVTTERDCEIDGQVDCGKMHDLVSKRRRSPRTSERAGSCEAVRRTDRQRETILDACRGSERVEPGLVLGSTPSPVQLRKSIGSAARSMLAVGPPDTRRPAHRKGLWNDRHDARRGSQSWTPASPPLLGLRTSARPRAGRSRTQQRTFRLHGDGPEADR